MSWSIEAIYSHILGRCQCGEFPVSCASRLCASFQSHSRIAEHQPDAVDCWANTSTWRHTNRTRVASPNMPILRHQTYNKNINYTDKIIWNTIKYIQIVCFKKGSLSTNPAARESQMDSVPSFLMMLSRYERSCNWTSMMWLAKFRKAWCFALQKISESVFACFCISLATRSFSVAHKKDMLSKVRFHPKPNLCRPLCGSNCPHLPSTLWRHSMKRASVGILQLPFLHSTLEFVLLTPFHHPSLRSIQEIHCPSCTIRVDQFCVWSQPPSNRK